MNFSHPTVQRTAREGRCDYAPAAIDLSSLSSPTSSDGVRILSPPPSTSTVVGVQVKHVIVSKNLTAMQANGTLPDSRKLQRRNALPRNTNWKNLLKDDCTSRKEYADPYLHRAVAHSPSIEGQGDGVLPLYGRY